MNIMDNAPATDNENVNYKELYISAMNCLTFISEEAIKAQQKLEEMYLRQAESLAP